MKKHPTKDSGVGSKRPKEGDYFQIDLGQGLFAYGRVMQSPIYAFYDVISTTPLTPRDLDQKPFIFKIWVMRYAWKRPNWTIISRGELPEELNQRVWFSKQDAISGELTMYSTFEGKTIEKKATLKQLESLERAAAWDPGHIEERLLDHHRGVECKWVKLLKIKTDL